MGLREMLLPLAALAVCGLLGSFRLLTGSDIGAEQSNGVAPSPVGGAVLATSGLPPGLPAYTAIRNVRSRAAPLDVAMSALEAARQRARDRLAGGAGGAGSSDPVTSSLEDENAALVRPL